MNEEKNGCAEIFRKISVRASKYFLFGDAIRLYIRFLGYGSEPFICISNISIDDYKKGKDIGIIPKDTSFDEHAAKCVYDYLECSKLKGRVLYNDLYEVIKDCLKNW